VRTAEGKLYLFVAIDRTSKFAFTRLVERATRREAADFLQELIEFVPYKIHTVLTDNGTHFTTPGNVRSAAADIKLAWSRGEHFRAHSFEIACAHHDIDHRLTKPNHPWTNGQVERMNRTIKEATVRTYHYDGTRNYGSISARSSTPIILPNASGAWPVLPLISSSVPAGRKNLNALKPIHTASLRD
jgi:transposase InsO family protein